MLLICPWTRGLNKSNMESCLSAVVSILLGKVKRWLTSQKQLHRNSSLYANISHNCYKPENCNDGFDASV